jgi:hypothetical protein
MTRRQVSVALLLALLLAGCGPESTKTVPEDLVGIWKTAHAKYADHPFELRRDSVTFGTGGGAAYTRPVRKVQRVSEDARLLYTIFYLEPEGHELKFSFYFEPARGGVIRWKHQETIEWTRAQR